VSTIEITLWRKQAAHKGYSRRWNGFGGKPEKDETMLQCATRELEVRQRYRSFTLVSTSAPEASPTEVVILQEEAGLSNPTLAFKGQFLITDGNATLREGSATSPLIHVFLCTSWTGEHVE
jgi:hypothetical protein